MKRFIIALILLLSIPIVLSASVSTDKNNYHPGDTVLILGSEFPSNIDVIIQINDPADTVKFVNQIRTDNDGNFSTTYNISSDAILGLYSIYASGGELVQENFTVSSRPAVTTTSIPSGGNGGGGGRTTTTTIINATTTTGRITTTLQPETTSTIPIVTTTISKDIPQKLDRRRLIIRSLIVIVPLIMILVLIKPRSKLEY